MHYRRFITFIYCHAITALVGTTDKPVKHCQHRQSPGKVNVAAAPPARQSERFIRESGMGYMTRPSGLILRFTNKVVHGSEAFPFSGTHNCVIFCGADSVRSAVQVALNHSPFPGRSELRAQLMILSVQRV